MRRILGRSFLALVTLTLVAPLANATLITVLNPGFESQVLSPVGQFTTPITDWTLIGTSGGVLRPTTAEFPGGAPEGQNTAFSNGVIIDQVLSSNLAVGTYTLQIDVGRRADIPTLFTGYDVQFLANGQLLAQDNNTLSVPLGSFVTSTVTYTALAGNPNLGKALEIRFGSPGVQTNFDDVRLDLAGVAVTGDPLAVPEPCTLVMAGTGALALGVLALFGFGWRQRRAAA